MLAFTILFLTGNYITESQVLHVSTLYRLEPIWNDSKGKNALKSTVKANANAEYIYFLFDFLTFRLRSTST